MTDSEEERARRIEATAAEAFAIWETGRQVAPFAARHPGFDLDEAYAVAARVRELRASRGERPIGRKIGFTNRTVQIAYGVDGPIWNTMFDSTVFDLAAIEGRFALAGLPEPRIEPEIVFHFAAAPRPEMDDDELLRCVDWIAHGFEVVQSIFAGWRFAAADAVAAYGLHGAYFIGQRRPVADDRRAWRRSLSEFTIELVSDDGVLLAGHATNVLGGPLRALRHLLIELDASSAGDPVRPGELVTTGTLTDAPRVGAGQTWSTKLSGTPLEGLRLQFS